MAGNITPEQIAKARASGYSDEQIADHLSQQMPDQFKQAADAGYTPTQVLDHLGGQDQPVTATGLAKSVGTGLVRGGEYLAGLPGDAVKGVDWLLSKTGADDATRDVFKRSLPFGIGAAPSSADIVDAETRLTGGLHTAGNRAERIAENVSSFVPGALGGPEALIANVLKRGILPGVASEVAGQATEGTPLEMPARVLGSLVSKGAKAPVGPLAPTDAFLRAEGGAGSQAVRDMQYATDGKVSDRFINTTLNDLDRRNINAKTSPETTGILNDYKDRPFLTSKDYDELKLRLNASSEPASGDAVKALYSHIDGLQPQHALFGDPAAFQSVFNDAKGNYAAGMRGAKIENAISNAQDASAKANSGMNGGNAIRNTLSPLTKDRDALAKASGFNAEEIAQMRKITDGTFSTNLRRQIGNRLGGGGGPSSMLLAGLGGAAGGASGGYEGAGEGTMAGLSLALLGHLSRSSYNAAQMSRARALSELVRSRAPAMSQTMSVISPSVSPGVQRILNMAHAVQVAHSGP